MKVQKQSSQLFIVILLLLAGHIRSDSRKEENKEMVQRYKNNWDDILQGENLQIW